MLICISRRYPAQTISDADYADDIELLRNTSAQAETVLHCLERAAASIGPHVNTDKTEYMCFNQRGDISTINGSLGNSVPSTKKDNTRLAKAWIAIDSLSVIWKSDLTDKIKRSFFPSGGRIDTAI